MASRSSGHDVSSSFGGDNGPDGTRTTPTTPSTPTTPTTHITGSSYGRKFSRQYGGQNFGDDNNALQNNPRLARNLELAYEGDDSELLPWPTNSSRPSRPRTVRAGYDRVNHILFVRFRPGADRSAPDGAGYEYDGVTPAQWREFRSSPSPGRYINRVLNYHPYRRSDW